MTDTPEREGKGLRGSWPALSTHLPGSLAPGQCDLHPHFPFTTEVTIFTSQETGSREENE